MFTQEKLKKLHRILTSKISRASKKLSLNLKIKKARDISYNNKKNMIIKSNSVKGKKKKINQNKNNMKKQKSLMDKTFQSNISVLSEIKKKDENFNDSFASYLTDNNILQKNKIKNVTIIKNHNKEFYDKSLLYHVMKYYITKSNNSSIKFDHLYYIFKPMTNYIHNSKNKKFNQSMNEKRNYLYYLRLMSLFLIYLILAFLFISSTKFNFLFNDLILGVAGFLLFDLLLNLFLEFSNAFFLCIKF